MTSTLPVSPVNPAHIQEVLDGRWAHIRREARELLRDPDFAAVYGETMPQTEASRPQGDDVCVTAL